MGRKRPDLRGKTRVDGETGGGIGAEPPRGIGAAETRLADEYLGTQGTKDDKGAMEQG